MRTILSQRITSLSLVYNPIASLPGLARRRHHAVPQRAGSARASHRWPHQSRGSALSETSEFLIIHALTRAPMWSAAGYWRTPDISVRVGIDELLDDVLVDVVLRALRMSRLDPRRVTLEIAGMPACHADQAMSNIHKLKQLGIRMSTDTSPEDSQVDARVFDEVRLDLGVSRTGAYAERVRRTVELARARDQAVLARGVSTGQRLMTALDLGATHVQGTLAGTPYADSSSHTGPPTAARRPVYSAI